MAGGSNFGGLLPLAITVVGIVKMIHGRARRRAGRAEPDPDSDGEKRKAAALEMERRMASYLAGRDTGRHSAALDQEDEETKR
jgi:hypothetical protein